MTLPLDWQASEESRYNKTAALAIIKLPAKVSIADPTYGGAVITNGGGPEGFRDPTGTMRWEVPAMDN